MQFQSSSDAQLVCPPLPSQRPVHSVRKLPTNEHLILATNKSFFWFARLVEGVDGGWGGFGFQAMVVGLGKSQSQPWLA